MNLKDLLDLVKQKKNVIENGVVRSYRDPFLYANLKNIDVHFHLCEKSFFSVINCSIIRL
jgi:hypothetical protein